jgi:hypothetical protein
MKTGDRENKDPSLTLRLTGDSRTTEQNDSGGLAHDREGYGLGKSQRPLGSRHAAAKTREEIC